MDNQGLTPVSTSFSMLLQSPISSEPHICPHCGRIVPPKTYVLPGRQITVQPICECESEADDREKRDIERRERKSRIEGRYSALHGNKRLRECGFDNFIEREGTKTTFIMAKMFADTFPATGNLYVFGTPGNGKSHLAAAIGNQIGAGLDAVIMIKFTDLLERIKSTFNRGSDDTESNIMTAVSVADLLILDDVGVEKASDFTLDVLFRIVDRRNVAQRPTVFTSNYGPVELIKRLGTDKERNNTTIEAQRIVGRMMEGGRAVENKGTDMRMSGGGR